MDTYSINPASTIDEAVDLSMRLTGTDFPVSIFPTKIQRIISEVHECHSTSLQSYHPLCRWSYLY